MDQEDIVNNYKNRTDTIIDQRNKNINDKKSFSDGITAPDDETIKNNLIYFLSGLDTTNIQLVSDKKIKMVVNPLYKNKNVLLPFESISINIRNLKRFVSQMQYFNDSIKRIVAYNLIERIEKYHEKVLNCFNKEIEDIYVYLSNFIDEFNELNNFIVSIEILSELEILDCIREKSEKCYKNYYFSIIEQIKEKIFRESYLWMRYGELTEDFYIKKNNLNDLQFDESYWTDEYKLIKNIPFFLAHNAKIIYKCGLLVNFMKKIPELKNKSFDFCFEQKDCNILSNSRKDSFISENENIIANKTLLSLYNTIKDEIEEKIKNLITDEINKIYNICFFTNESVLSDIFDYLQNDIYSPIENVLYKINQMNISKGFKFKYSDERINHFVLKVLNVDKIDINIRKTVLENLSVEINLKENILSLFFTKKLLFEIELISRYIITISALHFCYIKSFKNNKNIFVLNVINFLQQLRSSMYFTISDFENKCECIDSTISYMSNFIKKCLNKFYLTNTVIFTIISDILDLFFDYIYVRGDENTYNTAFLALIDRLKTEMEKVCTDFCFLFYLNSFKKF